MNRHRIISFGAIAVVALTLSMPHAVHAVGERLFITAPAQVMEGERVSVSVVAASPSQAMNAVSGALSFSGGLSLGEIRKEGSVINFWTEEPRGIGATIRFEGVVLNPGYQGGSGKLFTITFTARKAGIAELSFTNAAILANDGLGSNIIEGFAGARIRITPVGTPPDEGSPSPVVPSRPVALPVITDYSALVGPEGAAFVKGKGQPGALTKIVFKSAALASVGEQFIASLQTKRSRLDEVLVKNDPENGEFQYHSPEGLVAGAYSATPFLVDESTNTERAGLGVQLLVNNSGLVRALVVLINVLALLIPVVGLGVLIYFIPWYSFRRMRVLKRRFGVEEEALTLSRHRLERQDNAGSTAHESTIGAP